MEFDSSIFRQVFESINLQSSLHEQNQGERTERIFYDSIHELIEEWQTSGDEGPIWTYLGMDESIFRDWVIRSKRSEPDA